MSAENASQNILPYRDFGPIALSFIQQFRIRITNNMSNKSAWLYIQQNKNPEREKKKGNDGRWVFL
jgi:hypothetical protein